MSGNDSFTCQLICRSIPKILNKIWFRVSLTLILGSCVLVSCRFPAFSIDDYSDVLQAQETSVYSVLEITVDGEVVTEGEVLSVSGLGSECSVKDGQCYFTIKVEDVVLSIHYFYDLVPDQPDCLNTTASEQALSVRSGDHVKVFGKYFGAGSISTCGDSDYYIEVVPLGD